MNKFKKAYHQIKSEKKLPIALSLDENDKLVYNIILNKLWDKNIGFLKVNPAFIDTSLVETKNMNTILDGKFNDVKHTMEGYRKKHFKNFNDKYHAVTLSPYCGENSLKVFTNDSSIFSFIWTLSSDTTTNLWQRPIVDKLFESEILSNETDDNVGLVIPSTQLDFISEVRDKFPNRLLLIPGIGVQNGSIKEIKKTIGIDNLIFVIGRRLINSENILEELKIIEQEIRK